MDDYISREAAIEKAVEYCTDDDGSCSKGHIDLRELLDDLENLPAADVKPVVRGKWIEFDEDSWECSNCRQLWTLNDGTPKENNMNYCPNCGAGMEW